jgi:hypothetical protein
MDVQCYFVGDRYQRGDVSMQFVPTVDQYADMLTKQLPGSTLRNCCPEDLGM